MKWEIEGELYLQENHYDQYDIVESYIITSDMNRDNIIYENKEWWVLPGVCGRERKDPSELVISGENITDWIEKTTKLEPANEEHNCTDWTGSFQPQTKKVRITVEEI